MVLERRQPPGRRARVRVQARADPRRRLLDPAEVGARPQARPGRRLHRGARRRPLRGRRGDGRRPLRPRRRARRRRRTSSQSELERINHKALSALEAAGDAAASLYSNQEALGHYETALSLRRRARTRRPRARIAEKLGDVALRLGRVDQAIEVWEQCLDFHRREEDLARVGDLHRKIGAGPLAQGRPRGLDRPLPEGDRPAQGRPALPRAGPPLRGGRLALHAHRRQHARDLRLREGAAAGGAPRRGGGGEPRPRDLRPRLRPHRRLRARPPEPRALGRAGARVRSRARRSARCSPSATTSRSPRPTTTGAGAAYEEALELAEQIGDLPSKVELHAALAQLAVHRGDWETVAARGRGLRQPRRARGPDGQALLPVHDARHAALARGRLRRVGEGACAAPPSSPSRWAAPRSPSSRCSGSPPRCASAATTPTPTPSSPGRSTSASAPASSPSRWRRSRRAPSTWRSPGGATRRARPPTRPSGSPTGCATRSARRRASRPGAPWRPIRTRRAPR